jgi:hypothetical protein
MNSAPNSGDIGAGKGFVIALELLGFLALGVQNRGV